MKPSSIYRFALHHNTLILLRNLLSFHDKFFYAREATYWGMLCSEFDYGREIPERDGTRCLMGSNEPIDLPQRYQLVSRGFSRNLYPRNYICILIVESIISFEIMLSLTGAPLTLFR